MSTVVHIIVHVICGAAIDADAVIRGKSRNYRILSGADVACLLHDGPLRRGAYIYAAWSAKRHQGQSGDGDVSTHEFWWFLGILTIVLPDARIFSHPSIAGSPRTAKGSLLIHQGQAATWCFAKENEKNGTSDAGLQETASLCRIF